MTPSTMNSVERVKCALECGQPDRVPMVEFLIDERVAAATVPGCVDSADCMDRLDLDAVGAGAFFDRVREFPDGTFMDEWGVIYKGNAEFVAHPVRGPIRTLDDAHRYQPPTPDAPERLGQLPELVRRYKGKRAIAFRHRAAFMWAAYLTGLDNLLVYVLTEPELANMILEKVLDCTVCIARNAIRAGADIVSLGDDYAHNGGPLMAPEQFREFVYPRLKKMVDAIHEEGALCVKHSDGYLWPILDLIVDAGPDALNPIDPVAGMDLGEMKKAYGSRVCLVGNIDCGELLSNGTEEQVREAVRHAIETAAPGGGYILSSSNSIHSGVNPRNLRAMFAAGREFGKY